MRDCPQGVHAFLRAYFHHKSADWPANRPFPLVAWSAGELARIPTYYIMDHDRTMAQTVAAEMPGEEDIAACRWLPDAELAVYAREYERNGFQGGLQWYRCRTSGRFDRELELYSGRRIEVPACFIAGAADWGIHQVPGALEAMQKRAADWAGTWLVDWAGHWVQTGAAGCRVGPVGGLCDARSRRQRQPRGGFGHSEDDEPMRMKDKCGIVTAAGSGMGRAGAVRFAREGAAVAVVDIDADAVRAVVGEIESAGGRAVGIPADLTRDEDSRRIVREAANALGGIDFVWNHVGHPGPASVEGIEMEDFDTAVTLNLRTVLVTTDAAIPELRARGGGALLYTASTSGLQASSFSPVYSAVKHGVVGFVKALGRRLAKENIRVNAICPGPVDTPMLRVFVARPDQQSTHGLDKEQLVARRGDTIPMGRPGTPEEVASAALFLLSDEASYITATTLAVDGGATA